MAGICEDHAVTGGRIYSVGYEGLNLQGLVERLVQSKVALLFDVRLNAVSRRPGFSKKALATALEKARITYVHEPLLGNPSENRDSFRVGDGSLGRTVMRERLENGSRPAVNVLVNSAQSVRVAVMCVERDWRNCHRQVITDMVKELDPEIKVLHLL
jgi:uncharacterized protein (DUF488 family)